jgi:hypothetical protein
LRLNAGNINGNEGVPRILFIKAQADWKERQA